MDAMHDAKLANLEGALLALLFQFQQQNPGLKARQISATFSDDGASVEYSGPLGVVGGECF